ncbi:12801_t:CDS:1 [Ambispora leptoticha]|uniref:12801_t:CDS:1 n=1 Tax=Ambispora leptoticha TaxID=144679 RepID=A0A9N8ZD37_9GLOM|nr:12801_t:CDS:1 [Ambispora leptoticha]
MGVKDLTKLLKRHAPEALVLKTINDFRGKTLAIDASLFIRRFVKGAPHNEIHQYPHIVGFYHLTMFLRQHGIKPIFVFDGKRRVKEKRQELLKRKALRENTNTGLKFEENRKTRLEKWENVVEKMKNLEDAKTEFVTLGIKDVAIEKFKELEVIHPDLVSPRVRDLVNQIELGIRDTDSEITWETPVELEGVTQLEPITTTTTLSEEIPAAKEEPIEVAEESKEEPVEIRDTDSEITWETPVELGVTQLEPITTTTTLSEEIPVAKEEPIEVAEESKEEPVEIRDTDSEITWETPVELEGVTQLEPITITTTLSEEIPVAKEEPIEVAEESKEEPVEIRDTDSEITWETPVELEGVIQPEPITITTMLSEEIPVVEEEPVEVAVESAEISQDEAIMEKLEEIEISAEEPIQLDTTDINILIIIPEAFERFTRDVQYLDAELNQLESITTTTKLPEEISITEKSKEEPIEISKDEALAEKVEEVKISAKGPLRLDTTDINNLIIASIAFEKFIAQQIVKEKPLTEKVEELETKVEKTPISEILKESVEIDTSTKDEQRLDAELIQPELFVTTTTLPAEISVAEESKETPVKIRQDEAITEKFEEVEIPSKERYVVQQITEEKPETEVEKFYIPEITKELVETNISTKDEHLNIEFILEKPISDKSVEVEMPPSDKDEIEIIAEPSKILEVSALDASLTMKTVTEESAIVKEEESVATEVFVEPIEIDKSIIPISELSEREITKTEASEVGEIITLQEPKITKEEGTEVMVSKAYEQAEEPVIDTEVMIGEVYEPAEESIISEFNQAQVVQETIAKVQELEITVEENIPLRKEAEDVMQGAFEMVESMAQMGDERKFKERHPSFSPTEEMLELKKEVEDIVKGTLDDVKELVSTKAYTKTQLNFKKVEFHILDTMVSGKPDEDLVRKVSTESHNLVISLQRRVAPVTPKMIYESQEFLRSLGMPCITVEDHEAEAMCATLTENGMADASVTEDMDAALFGDGPFLRSFLFRNKPILEISAARAREQLQLSQDAFIDVCILCGTDFAEKIKGIGPMNAYRLVKQHGSIERVIENLDQRKYPIKPDFIEKVQGARMIFKNPPPLQKLRPQDLEIKPPNEKIHLLLDKYEINENMGAYDFNEVSFHMDNTLLGIDNKRYEDGEEFDGEREIISHSLGPDPFSGSFGMHSKF